VSYMPRARKYQALRDRHRLCRPASVRFFVVAVAAVPAAAARVIEKDRDLNWHVSRVWLSLAYGDAAVSNGRRHGAGACCASGIWLPLVA